MNATLAYLGHSSIHATPSATGIRLMPNLTREQVAFDAALRSPVRFREAISALHDVVLSDLRHHRNPDEEAAYELYRQRQREMERALYREAYAQRSAEILARRNEPVPPDLEQRYGSARHTYWQARRQYDEYIRRTDPALWRMMMPYDPVVTVADDVVFFECFSADESSYGCLTVDRDGGFSGSADMQAGTTNVDFSQRLFDEFQRLRSYRGTRLQVDPGGFNVATADHPGYREEKIDLPAGWLRGFLQVQAAMALPMQRISIDRGALYSIIAHLRTHRERKSPRALRFELTPGRPPVLVLEPWELRIETHGPVYTGPPTEPIRTWGRRRLMALERLLPIADRIDVYLIGSGLPSFWVVRMGEMRLTLGLSGWTASDWTGGSGLDQILPPTPPSTDDVARVSSWLHLNRRGTLKDVSAVLGGDNRRALSTLNKLAHNGDVIHDLSPGLYRWRRVMQSPVTAADLGVENPEEVAANGIPASAVRIEESRAVEGVGTRVTGVVQWKKVEMLINHDGIIVKAKCPSSHHFKYGLKRGPSRFLIALRREWLLKRDNGRPPVDDWYSRISRWVGGS